MLMASVVIVVILFARSRGTLVTRDERTTPSRRPLVGVIGTAILSTILRTRWQPSLRPSTRILGCTPSRRYRSAPLRISAFKIQTDEVPSPY